MEPLRPAIKSLPQARPRLPPGRPHGGPAPGTRMPQQVIERIDHAQCRDRALAIHARAYAQVQAARGCDTQRTVDLEHERRRHVHLPQRQTPLLVQYIQPTTVDARIQLPPGVQLFQATPPVELSEFGHFVQRVTQTPGQSGALNLHAELSLPLTRVPPERYAQFVEFARRLDSAEESIAVLAVRP